MVQQIQIQLICLVVALNLGCSKAPAPLPPEPSLEYVVKVIGTTEQSQPLPMVIALHGLGDHPDSFLNLFNSLHGPARIIAVQGIAPWGKGFTWFPTMLTKEGTPENIHLDFENAGKELAITLKHLMKKFPSPILPIVTGYSQGGAMSFLMASQYPETISLALPISGFLPEDWVPKTKPKKSPPIIAFHGTIDQRVSFEKTKVLISQLSEVGFSAKLRAYQGVHHTISPKERLDWLRELQKAIQRKE